MLSHVLRIQIPENFTRDEAVVIVTDWLHTRPTMLTISGDQFTKKKS